MYLFERQKMETVPPVGSLPKDANVWGSVEAKLKHLELKPGHSDGCQDSS